MTDTQYTADKLRRCSDELMKSVDKMIDRGQVTKATYDKATQPAILLRAGADAMDALVEAEARVKVLEQALEPFSYIGFLSTYSEMTPTSVTVQEYGYPERAALLSTDDFRKALAALQVKPKPDATGTGWKLSDEAKKDIAEIERYAKFYR